MINHHSRKIHFNDLLWDDSNHRKYKSGYTFTLLLLWSAFANISFRKLWRVHYWTPTCPKVRKIIHFQATINRHTMWNVYPIRWSSLLKKTIPNILRRYKAKMYRSHNIAMNVKNIDTLYGRIVSNKSGQKQYLWELELICIWGTGIIWIYCAVVSSLLAYPVFNIWYTCIILLCLTRFCSRFEFFTTTHTHTHTAKHIFHLSRSLS